MTPNMSTFAWYCWPCWENTPEGSQAEQERIKRCQEMDGVNKRARKLRNQVFRQKQRLAKKQNESLP